MARICFRVADLIGWPLNMDGSTGATAEAVAAFEEKLKNRTSIPITRFDERLTSRSAEMVLIDAGTRREKRKGVVDKMAAQLLLQALAQCLSRKMGRQRAAKIGNSNRDAPAPMLLCFVSHCDILSATMTKCHLPSLAVSISSAVRYG